jgi:predicted Zn finger-like uncharacterized protein
MEERPPMIRVACPECQTRYRFDESQLGGKARARAKCKKCGSMIDIGAAETAVPLEFDETTTGPDTAKVTKLRSDEALDEQTVTGQRIAEVLELPSDNKYSLAVLQGKASGQIFEIHSVRTTIGRADCDIVLDDPECSRRHAVVEVLGSRAAVMDLKSTNGTFVNGEAIQRAELDNHNEFRIGEHVLMLIVTDRE